MERLRLVDYIWMKVLYSGPALLEAALLEKDQAVFPRVILSDETVRIMRTHLEYYADGQAPQIKAILVDEDGKYFIKLFHGHQ